MTASTMTGRVVTIDPLTDPRWTTLISGSPLGLFLSHRWLAVLQDTYGFTFKAAAIEAGGELQAALPYSVIDDARGRRVRALPFCDLIDIPHEHIDQVRVLQRHLADLDLPTELVVPAALEPADAVWNTAITHHWHTVPLADGVTREELLAACGKSARNRIRFFEREDRRVWADPDPAAVDEYFDLHLGVRKYRHELLPQPREMFRNIASRFFESGDGWVVKAEIGGEIGSACLVLRHEDTLAYKFSASDATHRKSGASIAAAFGAVTHGLELGCARVDLGRTPIAQKGLVDFKIRLGATAEPVARARIDRPLPASAAEIGATLGQLTGLFCNEAVPDAVTEAAGSALYRYFA